MSRTGGGPPVPHVLYVVEITVDREAAVAFAAWLGTHVDEMLALPGFRGATIYERLEPGPSRPDANVYAVHYLLGDRDALDRYLAKDAPRMRADGVARFGARFTAERSVFATPLSSGDERA